MPTVQQLRVLLVPVGEPSRLVEIADDVKGLQQLLGGYFAPVTRVGIDDQRALMIWCNEGGGDLPANRSPIVAAWYAGTVRGPIVVTAADLSDGEAYSLNSFEIELLAAVEAGRPLPGRG